MPAVVWQGLDVRVDTVRDPGLEQPTDAVVRRYAMLRADEDGASRVVPQPALG